MLQQRRPVTTSRQPRLLVLEDTLVITNKDVKEKVDFFPDRLMAYIMKYSSDWCE